MTNHVHFVGVPAGPESLGRTCRDTHQAYMEIETKVSLADLPEAVAGVITAKAGGRKILEIEKEETLAAPRLVKLESPLVFYEAKAIKHLWYRKLKVRPDGTIVGKSKGKSSALPAAAAEALKKAFPDATFDKIDREREGRARLHEVKLRHPGREIEVKLAPDGTVVEVETKVGVADLPEAAAEVIREFARFAIMLRLEKKEVFARTAPVRLPKPSVVYEAEIRKSLWRKREIEVAPDGKVVKDTDGWKRGGGGAGGRNLGARRQKAGVKTRAGSIAYKY